MESIRLYKANELAEILNLNPQTIYRLAKKGEIESYKIGKSVRFVMPKNGSEDKQNGKEINAEG